jgi:hypothetical protein
VAVVATRLHQVRTGRQTEFRFPVRRILLAA